MVEHEVKSSLSIQAVARAKDQSPIVSPKRDQGQPFTAERYDVGENRPSSLLLLLKDLLILVGQSSFSRKPAG